MPQEFTDTSPEALSKLFPIILTEHNPAHIQAYLTERDFLLSVFGDAVLRISHIGSTAVPGLIAKPTVDILLEVKPETDLSAITALLTEQGYIKNEAKSDIITYIKGYTPQGFVGQAYHIHVRNADDWGELDFRDYLIAHPETAREYGELKQKLKGEYEFNRDGYTGAKGEFIRKITALAKQEFAGRYLPEA